MSKNIKEQIKNLARLQDNETGSQRIKADLNNIAGYLEPLDLRLETFKNEIKNNESVINEVNKTYRSLESDVKKNLSGIKKSEEKLRAVKTNKEYQFSLKEIDALKANNSKIEDEMIQCLDRMDELESIIEKKNNDYLKLSKQIILEKEAVQKKEATGRKKLEEINKQNNEIAALINPELLEKFFKVKSLNKNNVAIAAVENAICSGCNLNVPPQMYNELQRFDSLQFCPFCHRMIYSKD